MNYFIEGVTPKYACFSGRARRAEFWYFVLFLYVVWLVLSAILGFLVPAEHAKMVVFIVTMVYNVAIFVPSWAVLVRRLQDTNHSGWNTLWIYTVVGVVVLLKYLVTAGDHGPNQYGEDPKGSVSVETPSVAMPSADAEAPTENENTTQS